MFPECEMRVIAFFGLQGNVGCLPQAFDVLVDMSRRLHCEPNLLSGAGGRLGGFRNIERRLRKSNFSEVRSFEFYSLPDGIDNRLKGVNVSGCVSFRTSPQVVIDVRNSLLESPQLLLDACREVAKLVRPLYGIGFRQPFRCGPTLFASGMRCPGTRKEDREILTAHFGNLMYQYYSTKGLLSDLFEDNFLTAAQLDRPVGNRTFREWILSDPNDRGSLTPFTDNLWLWRLSPEHIVALRPILKAAGRIIDFWHEARLRDEEAFRRGASPATSESILQALVGDSKPSDIDIVAFGGEKPPRQLSDAEENAILKSKRQDNV